MRQHFVVDYAFSSCAFRDLLLVLNALGISVQGLL
jgi:hypothetical protein